METQFIAVVFQDASCVSTVRLTACRNERNHAMEVAFAKVLSGTTLRWPIQRTSSVGRMIIYACVGPWAMHDGMYQKAQEASYLYANVAEHLMTLKL